MLQVIIRRLFTGGWVYGQGSLSGLIIITSVFGSVPLSLGHVHFQLQFHHLQLPTTYYMFFFLDFLTMVHLASHCHHRHHPQVLFLEPPFLQPSLITFLFQSFAFLGGGGAPSSDSSFSCDSSLSFLLDLLCGLPTSLSCWHPSCLCSLILDKALCTKLKDSPHFSATDHIPPTLLITLSLTAMTTTML